MPKGGLLVNTARKEVINEAELIQLMEERTDFKYMTDIMPAANEKFANCLPDVISLHRKRWEHRLPKPISTQVLPLPQQIVGLRKFRVNRK